MAQSYQDIVICVLTAFFFFTTYLIMQYLQIVRTEYGIRDSWIIGLLINLLGYSCVILPGFVAYKYVKSSQYLEKSVGCISQLMRQCFGEPGLETSRSPLERKPNQLQKRSARQETVLLFVCFVGLQGSYLIWGLLQEKIMTQEYIDTKGNKLHFKDSQFLVFVNRILAFFLSGLYILVKHQPPHICPLYKYGYCSLSNILSSWCQYEALKFVTFPTQSKKSTHIISQGAMIHGYIISVAQVLGKASKIIPVMIMGKFVSKKKYHTHEYVTAVLISIGMVFFLMDNQDGRKGAAETTFSGLILMGMYIVTDSFTSNWQNELCISYGVTSIQMMCGVNLFSCMFTAISLSAQDGFQSSFKFMVESPPFMVDCLLLSICSATGQLFIFYTISQFGPVVFVIITTLRQVFAVLLSCIIYHHNLSAMGVMGVAIVFIAIFLRFYCNERLRTLRKQQTREVEKI